MFGMPFYGTEKKNWKICVLSSALQQPVLSLDIAVSVLHLSVLPLDMYVLLQHVLPLDVSVLWQNFGMPRNEQFLSRYNKICSKSIPRNVFGTKFR